MNTNAQATQWPYCDAYGWWYSQDGQWRSIWCHGYGGALLYEHRLTGGQQWDDPFLPQNVSGPQCITVDDDNHVTAHPFTRLDKITAVPAEIRAEIFSYLATTDLLTLCRTSRICQDSAEELIYCIHRPDDWKEYDYLDIIRKMISCPRIAGHVHTVKIGTWSSQPSQPMSLTNLHFFVNAAIISSVLQGEKSAEQHIEDAGIIPYTIYANLQVSGFLRTEPGDFKRSATRSSTDQLWIQSLYVGYQEPQVMLLLSLFVKLKKLHIGRVAYGNFFSDRIFPITHGLQLCNSLRTLCTSKCIKFISESELVEPSPIRHGSFDIKYLYFKQTVVNPPELENLLLACKRLALFSYQAKSTRPKQVDRFASKLRRVIEHHSSSLSCLRVSLFWNWVEEPWKALKGFVSLKFLEVDQRTLTGGANGIPSSFIIGEILPESLEVLNIVRPLPSLNRILLQILDALDQYFPNLNKVFVQFEDHVEDWFKDTAALEEQFQQKYVTFKVDVKMWNEEEDDSCPIGEWVKSKLPPVANIFKPMR